MINRETIISLLCFFTFVNINGAYTSKNSNVQEEGQKSNKASVVSELACDNGGNFWFMRDETSQLIHIKIAFKNAGSAYQEKTKAGLPVFYSKANFCGSGKYSKSEFARKCLDLSIIISCSADLDNIYFFLTAPKIVLKDAIGLFNLVITSPTFKDNDVKKVQNSIGNSLLDYVSNPIEVALSSFVPPMIFESHPYENGILGSIENFMKLSIADLKNYQSKFLVTSNAEICMFGNLTENEAISAVDKIFFGIKSGKKSTNNIKDVTPKLSLEVKKYYADGPQTTVLFVLKNEKPQSAKRYAASVLYKILGDSPLFKSRILSELRTKKGLIYTGQVHNIDMDHSSYILGVLQTDNSHVSNVILLLKSIIKNLKEKGITKSELEFAKNNIKGEILVKLRTLEDICSFYFVKKLQRFGTTILSDILNGIDQVTLEEVNHLAEEILDEDNMPFIVIGGGE